MSPGWTLFVEILATLASVVVILDYFGIKPDANAWRGIMSLSQRWKLVIMLLVVALSLGLSLYSFYRSRNHKLVEKEKIVEKLVPQECPKCESLAAPPKKTGASLTAPHGAPPQTATGNNNGQVAGNITTGNCNAVQVGGNKNQAQVNCTPPPLELAASLRDISGTQGKLEFSPNKCPVKTQIRIVPNQAVPPPVGMALDFDNPVTQMGAVVEGINMLSSGGPGRLEGRHVLITITEPGISRNHPMIIETCSALPLRLTGPPHLE